jgi:uncharacterized protein
VTETTRHQRVLLDTGPLVALRNSADREHDRCLEMLAHIDPPLLTCWPVVTEAAWLLRHNASSVRRMLQAFDEGLFRILVADERDLPPIETLLLKYEDLAPQLADVTLLHLAQREGLDTVFTLDRRDFSVFRLKARKRLRLLPADGN